MKLILTFLFCLFLLTACLTKEEPYSTTEFPVNIKENRLNSLTDVFDFGRFIYLETHPKALINRINRLYFTKEDNIIIFDEKGQKVLLFDQNGKFIRIIGQPGNGPAEYNSPSDMAFDRENNHIYVLTRGYKIQVYDITGKHIKSIRSNLWSNNIYFYNNQLFVYSNRNQEDETDRALFVMDTNGKIIQEFIQLPVQKAGITYSNLNHFCETNNDLKIISVFDYNIYSFKSGNVSPVYRFNFLKNNAPEGHISSLKTPAEFDDFLDNSYVHSIDRYYQIENLIYLNVMADKKNYSIFINQNTGTVKTYFHRNLHDLFVQLAPIAVHKEQFVNVFFPHYRLSKYANYDFRIRYCKDKIEQSLMDEYDRLLHMKLDQNPVLILTKPKMFK